MKPSIKQLDALVEEFGLPTIVSELAFITGLAGDKDAAQILRDTASKLESDDDSDDDDDDDDDEPDEDSITTKDDRKWYQYGKLYFTGSREDLFEKMDDDKFWPDVFTISDHGNAIRIEREGEEE